MPVTRHHGVIPHKGCRNFKVQNDFPLTASKCNARISWFWTLYWKSVCMWDFDRRHGKNMLKKNYNTVKKVMEVVQDPPIIQTEACKWHDATGLYARLSLTRGPDVCDLHRAMNLTVAYRQAKRKLYLSVRQKHRNSWIQYHSCSWLYLNMLKPTDCYGR